MARVNYQRDKRLKDIARQRKQEEKRQKKLNKDPETEGAAPETGEAAAVEGEQPEGAPAIPAGEA